MLSGNCMQSPSSCEGAGLANKLQRVCKGPQLVQTGLFLSPASAEQFLFQHPHFPVSLVKLRPCMLEISNGD